MVMNTRNLINIIISGLAVVTVFLFQSCDTREIESYDAGRALFFERWKQVTVAQRERIDTVAYSFSHYVGKTELVHPFKINLIGGLLTEDTEYDVIVVDSLTTALPEQYSLPEPPVFHKGQASDVLNVTLYKKPSLQEKEVYLTLRLVATGNFGLGYVTYSDVKIRFNDKKVKPIWWTEEVETAYLGIYSYKKLETIIAANEGFITFEGLSGTEKRKIALNTKIYIADKKITEVDGSAMLIPMY